MQKNKIFCLFICLLIITTVYSTFSVEAIQPVMDNDIDVSIGAGMIRFTIAGFSHARRIGFGTNIRVINKGTESKDGSWELVYYDFSGEEIINKKGNFTISPDDLLPYLQGVIIHTTLSYKISKVSMTVRVGDYTITRTGIRIGPLVILGQYAK